MTQQTTHRNTRAQKAQSARCIRCGRALKRDSTQTVLGVVGPECEQYVVAALNELSRNGLRDIALHGEIRLPALKTGETTYSAPPAAHEYHVLAARVGVQLAPKFDVQTKEYILVLSQGSARELLNRARGVQA